MTQDEWRAIVRAWAAWVNGEGPPVQGRITDTGWILWTDTDAINRKQFPEWRVKPPRMYARFVKTRYGINYATKLEGEPDPEISAWSESKWIGEWQRVPE